MTQAQLMRPDQQSGGTHTSRTIMLEELRLLLSAFPRLASREDYARAILEDNVLSKRSDSTRQRSLRHLRELYALDPSSVLFRALLDLWDADPQSQPLLALQSALARDPLLRATAPPVLSAAPGSRIDAAALASAVANQYPNSYSPEVAAKIGRNAASSWTQSGHLRGKYVKVRIRANSRPSAVAFALLIGHLADARGSALFDTVWARSLDAPRQLLVDQAFAAAQRGWIEFRQAGDVIDVGFHWLLRPLEGMS